MKRVGIYEPSRVASCSCNECYCTNTRPTSHVLPDQQASEAMRLRLKQLVCFPRAQDGTNLSERWLGKRSTAEQFVRLSGSFIRDNLSLHYLRDFVTIEASSRIFTAVLRLSWNLLWIVLVAQHVLHGSYSFRGFSRILWDSKSYNMWRQAALFEIMAK